MRNVGVQFVVTKINLGTDSTNPASVGVNYTAANRNTLWEAQLVGSLLAKLTNALTSTGKFAALFTLLAFRLS